MNGLFKIVKNLVPVLELKDICKCNNFLYARYSTYKTKNELYNFMNLKYNSQINISRTMYFANWNLDKFIEFIKYKNTVLDILSVCVNQQECGFYF